MQQQQQQARGRVGVQQQQVLRSMQLLHRATGLVLGGCLRSICWQPAAVHVYTLCRPGTASASVGRQAGMLHTGKQSVLQLYLWVVWRKGRAEFNQGGERLE